jgi:hypothetical protein
MGTDSLTPVDLTAYRAGIQAARSIHLPRHVREAYRWVELRDVFLDGLGRIWFAETDTLRSSLPADPMVEKKVPPEFWHPERRKKKQRMDYEEARWAKDLELVP